MTAAFGESAERFTCHWVGAQPIVASFISSLVPNHQDGQDLLQKTALAALKKFPEFDERHSFARWAIGIARFEILAHQRAHARSRVVLSPALQEQMAEACEELSLELEARRRWLARCVGELQGRAAELVRLRYLDGLSFEIVATRLGCSPVAARVAVSRVRAVLRECIERNQQREDA